MKLDFNDLVGTDYSYNYRNIVVLTGAGISAESGIATFRSQDGLWENHSIESVATPEGYQENPKLVQAFYNERRRQLLDQTIQPNAAHKALAQLEKFVLEQGGQMTVVTQNIDDLHERAGSKSVLHMHGELLKSRCPESNQTQIQNDDLHIDDLCHCCQLPNPLRPHVVWFGEMPLFMTHIYTLLEKADLFISIGTSGVVYPAAGFVRDAKLHGAHTIEVNIEPSAIESEFKERHYGLATQEVPEIVHMLIEHYIM